MNRLKGALAVIGHACLDISVFPDWIPEPGGLQVVGPLQISTGGAVPNVAGAAAKLGLKTIAVFKVGQDLLGEAIKNQLLSLPHCAVCGISSPDDSTSSTVVLNVPGKDRAFMHCPGTNDSFVAEDVPYGDLSFANIVHFGYPTLMRGMYEYNGVELGAIFKVLRNLKKLTSLDLSDVNEGSDALKADWEQIFRDVLPYTDFFLPSIGEIMKLIPRFRNYENPNQPDVWREITQTLLDWGAKVVVLKLGKQGLYGTSGTEARHLPTTTNTSWAKREILALPFKEKRLISTTGTGDTAIAGFLTAFLQSKSFAECLMFANAVSSCCVEDASATGGIHSWDETWDRVNSNWETDPFEITESGWDKRSNYPGIVLGPEDGWGHS